MTSPEKERAWLVDRAFATLREAERTARTRVQRDGEHDPTVLGVLVERPLEAAKAEVLEDLLGLGRPSNADLARALRAEVFEVVAARCVARVRSNANLRFRALLKLYSEAFLQVEMRIVDELDLRRSTHAKRVFPPIFHVGRLHLDDLRLPDVPSDDSEGSIAAWTEQLRARILRALLLEVAFVRRRVLASGDRRMAAVRVRLDLALRRWPAMAASRAAIEA